jgi:hypothetical protein
MRIFLFRCVALFTVLEALFMTRAGSATETISEIVVVHPFDISEDFKATEIRTVGDQILGEHINAFHVKESQKHGVEALFSNILIDRKRNLIKLTPRFQLMNSLGKAISNHQLAEACKASLTKTTHARYGSLLKSVTSDSTSINITLSKIPVNYLSLLTLPDFSIFDVESPPVSVTKEHTTYGPYSLAPGSTDSISLKINKFFPASLRANDVPNVRLKRFKIDSNNLEGLSPSTDHLIYIPGSRVGKNDLETLRRKGYHIEIFPSEWLIYLEIAPHVDISLRKAILQVVRKNQNRLINGSGIAAPAFGVSPSDRSFGVKDSAIAAPNKAGAESAIGFENHPFSVALHPILENVPMVRETYDLLQINFPKMRMEKVKNSAESFSDRFAVRFRSIGISAADPISHLYFLRNFGDALKPYLSEQELLDAATESDPKEFARKVKAIETRLVEKMAIIPIAHFPGIVASNPRFERDPDLAWGWGVQAWTYRIR